MASREKDFNRQIFLLRLHTARRIAAVGDITNGAIVRHVGSQRWAFLLPDMGEPGKWRMQYFDARGFSGHSIFASEDEVLRASVNEGFRIRDDQALDQIQDLPSFRRGNYLADLVHHVNSGQLPYARISCLLSNYDKGTTHSV